MLYMLTEDESSDMTSPECVAVWTGYKKRVYISSVSSAVPVKVLCMPICMCDYSACICCICVCGCVCVAMCAAREVALF